VTGEDAGTRASRTSPPGPGASCSGPSTVPPSGIRLDPSPDLLRVRPRSPPTPMIYRSLNLKDWEMGIPSQKTDSSLNSIIYQLREEINYCLLQFGCTMIYMKSVIK
jgi:hypothetical protein